jgi:hypothetical protein
MLTRDDEQSGELTLLGRQEYVSFPAWDLHRIRAKVDTGAFSSSLDVAAYEVIETDNGPILRMLIALSRRFPDRVAQVEEPVVAMANVCSSSGCRQIRPVIEPVIRLGSLSKRIRLTVSDRSKMRCRMLLGRQAIAGLFLVDVRHKYLLGDGRTS